jgi:hypothetical protein
LVRKTLSSRLESNQNIFENSFYIYCEGKNTEPAYFRSFNIDKETTKIEVVGLGRSRTALVEKVIELTENIDKEEVTQIWVVFDRDVRYTDLEEGNKDFNNAIKLANKNNIKCAYSNDCFELWFILHDEYLPSALHRNQFYEKLSERLNCKYEEDGKSIDFAKSLYGIYENRIQTAIKNAEKLHKSHSDKEYCHQNPCTTVYQLVEELNKNIRK